MANKRSSGSSRSRDLFRIEVDSLLADLGELVEEPAPLPAASQDRAEEPPRRDVELSAPSQPDAVEPAGAQDRAEEPPRRDVELSAPPQPDAVEPAEAPPTRPQSPPGPAVPAASGSPAGTPPTRAGEYGLLELEDLPSFSPSYLPPFPPILPAPNAGPDAAAAPEHGGSAPAQEPPSATQEWPPPPWEPGFEPMASAEWQEPSGPLPAGDWPDPTLAAKAPDREAPESGPTSTIHHHPAALPETWPSPSEPSRAEVETDRDGAEATAAFTAEWVPEREVPAWEAMETGPPKAQASDATAPETAVDDESASRWKVRPSPTQGPTPILAETPGWGLEMPPSTFSGRLPEPIPDIDAGQGQLGPSSTSVTRLAEPFGSLAGALPPSAREIPSPMAELPFGSVGGRFEPVPEGMMERTMERASNASPSQMPVGIAARVPTVSQRAGLPLLPGGTPPPVSTRPWSLAAAMQPIAPLAPTSARPGGAPAAEPARSVPSLTPTSGLNVPFPAVVAILVAVLLVIVVLILLDLHR